MFQILLRMYQGSECALRGGDQHPITSLWVMGSLRYGLWDHFVMGYKVGIDTQSLRYGIGPLVHLSQNLVHPSLNLVHPSLVIPGPPSKHGWAIISMRKP